MSVAIGVARSTGRLHVLSTVEHPERPLVMQSSHWESLRRATAPIKLVDWLCGDHGSDTETELELSTDKDGIHVTRTEYKCDENGKRGSTYQQRGSLGLRTPESWACLSKETSLTTMGSAIRPIMLQRCEPDWRAGFRNFARPVPGRGGANGYPVETK